MLYCWRERELSSQLRLALRKHTGCTCAFAMRCNFYPAKALHALPNARHFCNTVPPCATALCYLSVTEKKHYTALQCVPTMIRNKAIQKLLTCCSTNIPTIVLQRFDVSAHAHNFAHNSSWPHLNYTHARDEECTSSNPCPFARVRWSTSALRIVPMKIHESVPQIKERGK